MLRYVRATLHEVRFNTIQMELIEFIEHGKPLTSPPVLHEFVEQYPQQCGGILGRDILTFVKMYTNDVTLVDDGNYRIHTKGMLFYVLNGSHMFYVFNDIEDGGCLEKWDPMTWQKSINNCTLYAGIVAVVRPLVGFEQTCKLLKNIIDDEGSEGANRLATISKHFFARGVEWFKYRA